MHILFPSKIDLSRVRFDPAELEDCRHNYNLLQTAFDEVGILRYIPVNDLINKKEAVCLQFLRWFKAFFSKNQNNRHYNALEARGGCSIATYVQLPKTTAVVCNITVTDKIIKDAPQNPVELLEEAEKLSVDILKTNKVLISEEKQQEDKTKTIPNLDQDTLKLLKIPKNQESHLITPAEEAEKCVKETHLKTNHINLKSANEDVKETTIKTQPQPKPVTLQSGNFAGVKSYSLVSLLPQPHPNNLNCYYLNVPQVQEAENLGKDNLKGNKIKLTPANVKARVEDKPKITNHIHQPSLNPHFAQTTNLECRANTGTEIPCISSNNFPQPLYCLYVTPLKQPQLVGMSTMSTNDVILISDTEDKPVEGTTTSTSNQNENQKRLVPSGPTSTEKSFTLNSQVCPSDLKKVCSQTPYCLYVDMGLELDKNSCVVLIGYFDRVSGASVVKKLDTLCINQSSTEQPVQSVITKHTANAAADLLISLLKKSELPLDNLKVFYCNIPEPEVNWMVVRKLMELNPHLVSLGGLACMAGGACQIALFECYSHVVDLINDIHHFKLPNFTGTNYNILLPVSSQYSAIITIIQNVSANWVELHEYFKTLHKNVGASRLLRILNQLQEHTVRLDFLFLSNALDLFRSFQDLQKNKTRDMVVELQMTSMLVHAYAASIFQPSAADQFVRNKDLKRLLVSDKELLPMSSVNVGLQAKKYLSSLSFDVLGEVQRSKFLTKAVRFYQTTLKILVESLPGQLSPLAMRNIGTLLKHPNNLMSQEVSSVQLTELGCQLGVCKTDSSTSQLASEYVNYIQMANNGRRKEAAEEEGLRWVKVLDSLASFPVLYKLILTLLAFPCSLQMKQIFKPQRRGLPPKALMHKRGRKIRYHQHRPERERGEASSSEEDQSRNQPSRPPVTPGPTVKQAQDREDSEYTDNSSDVVDVTEACKLTFKRAKEFNVSNGITPNAEKPQSVYILDSEDDQCKSRPATVKPTNTAPAQRQQGELVLIYLENTVSWPAVTVPYLEDNQEPDMKKVEWYGHNMTSEVCIEYLQPFADFAKSFSQNTFATVSTYREAVFLSLREASARCQKQFSASFDDKDEILSEMLDWAFGGFKPMGPKGFQPAVLEGEKNTFGQASNSTNTRVSPKDLPRVTVSLYKLPIEVSDKAGGADSAEKGGKRKSKSGWKGKGPRKKSTLFEDFTEETDMSPDFVPYKKRPYTKIDQSNKTNAQIVYTQPDQKLRERIIRRIMELKLDIEDFCLCCGTEDIVIFHPLFKGSLCLECKNNFTETLYRYDEDGYQSYCTICCYGMEVLLCGNDSCCRSFCADCLNILTGEGTFDSLKDLDPWICYLCQPHQTHGALTPRQDWSVRVQELFANNSAMEFEPHRVYPSIPANLRRPIRVLSLFDGIATGYLVLKELGFKVEKYIASEVCEDSIAVSTVNHDGKIIHVGDTRFITQEHLNQWGPFDLLIGGSPCNDLSIVNPLRKGLYEGTGRLFFEFYRILQLLKPKDEDPRPFFWLFENVVFMNVHDRLNICRFLECNPVLVDAVKVSPANRARYFWGNIPGMSRPIAASQTDKLNLQDCLEIGRVARVTKVRTITTNLNSLKQGKDVSLLPVLQNGTEDTLWITEIEKIFGFPKHYTDVRNMNRQQRQKVLGKAWSVPVIRHLFAPLKDYFACEELPPMTTSNASTSSSSPCPLSPGTPEMLQLR